MYSSEYILAGALLLAAGLLVELRKRDALLVEVARDNMALRFHILEQEQNK